MCRAWTRRVKDMISCKASLESSRSVLSIKFTPGKVRFLRRFGEGWCSIARPMTIQHNWSLSNLARFHGNVETATGADMDQGPHLLARLTMSTTLPEYSCSETSWPSMLLTSKEVVKGAAMSTGEAALRLEVVDTVASHFLLFTSSFPSFTSERRRVLLVLHACLSTRACASILIILCEYQYLHTHTQQQHSHPPTHPPTPLAHPPTRPPAYYLPT